MRCFNEFQPPKFAIRDGFFCQLNFKVIRHARASRQNRNVVQRNIFFLQFQNTLADEFRLGLHVLCANQGGLFHGINGRKQGF